MLWSVSKCLIAVLLGACVVNVFALEAADPLELKVTSSGSGASIDVDEQNINFNMVYPRNCVTKNRDDTLFNLVYGSCSINFKLDDIFLYYKDEPLTRHGKQGIDFAIDLKNSAISLAQNGSPVEIMGSNPVLICQPKYKEGTDDKAMDVSVSGSPKCNIEIKFKNRRYDPKSSTAIPGGGPLPVASAGLSSGAWVGIGIAICVVVALILGAICWFAVCAPRRRRQCTEKSANTAKPPTVSNTPMTCIVENEKRADAPQEVTAISQEPEKPKNLIFDKTEEDKKKVSKETEIRPRKFPLDWQQQRIADGCRVGRNDYPTMEDVKSDWGDTVTKDKKEKIRDALPTEIKKKSQDVGSRSTITDQDSAPR